MAKKKKKSTKKQNSSSKWVLLFFAFGLIGIFILYYFPKSKKINKSEFVAEIPKGFSSFGIDISHHQGEIDWNRLLKNENFDTIIKFVYCKATEGADHVDTKWEENRNTLNNRGIPNGAYHFFQPSVDPKIQAKHFLNHWKKREVDLPPVLDVEVEGKTDIDLIKNMKIWLNEIEQKTGMRPIIYSSLNFFETKFKNEFKNYLFWIAAYSQRPACLTDNRVIHWQYSENGELPGIEELVDFNVSKIAF